MRASMYDIPLTDEERAFAAEHHGLIYWFLNYRRLPEDEWYDIAALAYIRAVKKWFMKPEKRIDYFSVAAIANMNSLIGKEKAKAERYRTFSLYELIPGCDDITYEDMICDIHANDFAFFIGQDEREQEQENKNRVGTPRPDISTDDLIEYYKKCLSVTQTARKYGISQAAVSLRLKKAGVKTINKGAVRPDLSTDEMVEMYKSGMSSVKISIALHCGEKTVCQRLRKAGVEMRHNQKKTAPNSTRGCKF